MWLEDWGMVVDIMRLLEELNRKWHRMTKQGGVKLYKAIYWVLMSWAIRIQDLLFMDSQRYSWD
jgi:hypothetical protein